MFWEITFIFHSVWWQFLLLEFWSLNSWHSSFNYWWKQNPISESTTTMFRLLAIFRLAWLLEPGSMLSRIELWGYFGHAITSFIGCYKIAQETGSKFVPKTVPWCNSTYKTRPSPTRNLRIGTNGAPTSCHDGICQVSLEQYEMLWFKHRCVIRIIVVASKMKWHHKPPSVLFFTIIFSVHYTFLGNCPPTPPLSQHYFSLRAKCWLRGGVGGQFPRNV